MEGVAVPGRRGPPRRRPRVLVGDAAYSYGLVRRWARAHHVRAVLPRRKDQRRINARCRTPFDKRTYRKRCKVEHVVGHLKEFRAVATRYDKLALNYEAGVQAACILGYLHRLYPSDTA